MAVDEKLEEEILKEYRCNLFASIRTLTGLSQKDFAEKFRLEFRTVQNWEQGVSSPSDAYLYLLKRCVAHDEGLIGISHGYGVDSTTDYVLENGRCLYSSDWNGEEYSSDSYHYRYRPVSIPFSYDDDGEPDQWEYIGFEQLS